LAFTAWAGVPHIHAELEEKAYRSYQKRKFISLSTGHHLLEVQFTTSLESNSGTAVIKYNTTQHNFRSPNRIQSPSQDTTSLQPKVILRGTHGLLVVNVRTSSCKNYT
jgi:hypothetical protein